MNEHQKMTLVNERTGKLEDGSSFIFRHLESTNTDQVTVIEVKASPSSPHDALSDAIQQLSSEPKLASFPLWGKAPSSLTYMIFKQYVDRINQWAVDQNIVIHLSEDK